MSSEVKAEQQEFDVSVDETPLVGAQERMCVHCFVIVFDKDTSTVATVCGHKCGAVKDKRRSVNPEHDEQKARRTQEAFILAHRSECPRNRRAFYRMIP